MNVAAQTLGQGGGEGEARIALLADVVELADAALVDSALHACTSIGRVVALVACPAVVFGAACGALTDGALYAGGSIGGGVIELYAGVAYAGGVALEAPLHHALIAVAIERSVTSDAAGAEIG